MEEKIKIEQLVSHVKDYAEERVNLLMYNAQEKTSKAIAGTSSVLILLIIGIFTLGFLSLALAWYLGQLLEKPFLGFLIVGGFYLLAGLVIWMNRERWIGFPIMNAFLKNIADDED